MTVQDVEKVASELTRVNNLEFNMLKVIEESGELLEVLAKFISKSENLKPPVAKVSEEAGDLMFRLLVLTKHLDIEKDVSDRVHEKAEMLGKAIDNNKMGSTLKVTKTNK